MIVVADATPLIGLARIDHLDLLVKLFNQITIPQAVYDEVVTSAPQHPGAEAIKQASWIQVKTVADQNKVAYLRADLDPGEAESLVLAQELSADWLLLDEPKARLAAQLLDMRFIGTVGLLLLAKQRGHISQIHSLLDALIDQNFYLSQGIYQAVLKQAGEQDESR
jgi:predicted nucleic acid-binding protein